MNQETIDPDWMGEDDLYRENILDHYKNPHNFGKIDGCTFSARELNPLCGDQLQFFGKVEDGKLKEVKFLGHGCAISMASASMLTDKTHGMPVEDIKKLIENYKKLLDK